MAKLASIFISTRHLRMLGAATCVTSFLICLSLLVSLAHNRMERAVEAEIAVALDPYVRVSGHVASTFTALRREVTAAPCGAEFHAQLRKVAYLPDGLNEFFHAPGGRARCAVNDRTFDPPVDFGAPDFVIGTDERTAFWIDRDLSFADLPGETGTIVLREPFAMVVPTQRFNPHVPIWARAEAVLIAPDGRWWRREGEVGVHQRALIAREAGGILPFASANKYWTRCVDGGPSCLTVEASLTAILRENAGIAAVFVLLAGFVASWITRIAHRAVKRYWTFEARFRRNLDLDSIVCAYQPLLDLRSGEITGCEVLARWRDINDSIVYPDRFIPVVEKHGLTLELTRLVVLRAFRELDRHVPVGHRLQVNFNIFPRDLDAPSLIEVFAPFASARDRFDLVVEIVETDALSAHSAQAAIDELRKAGLRVYIDDFGTGYSNLHNLVDLAVDGVKLDRCFAMAPIDSLMCAMLTHAVDMVRAAGRVIVVEGVETAERLARLRADSRRIDFAQGYHISRPLTIERFAEFVTQARADERFSRAA
jgi:sensor c-di-GMP phosphodiesterase-like protein